MFHFENFYLFLTVSFLINLSPGPDMIYTAARTLGQGTRAGIFSAMGIFCGGLFHITAAVIGLSVVIEQSVLLFSIIKYAGAGYLVYLGLRALFSRKKQMKPGQLQTLSSRKIFFQGMLTNILNPKVAMFFLSFLPQFINPQSPFLRQQIAFLGFWFDLQGTIVLMTVAILAGIFTKALQKNAGFWNWQQKITGTILLGLGAKMLLMKK